jgi:hypothetical protein
LAKSAIASSWLGDMPAPRPRSAGEKPVMDQCHQPCSISHVTVGLNLQGPAVR